MTYIEFTRESCKKIDGKKLYEEKKYTTEQLEAFKQLLSCNDTIADAFLKCDSSRSFYKHFPDFKEMGINNTELFYSFKLGYTTEGIPSELVYILEKAIREYGTANPNSTLWSCYRLIEKYAEYYFKTENGDMILQDVIYAIFKKKFDFITPRRNISGNEVYVHNKDSIALLPDNILSEINGQKVFYDKTGLYIGEENHTLLRLMNGRIGVTVDDFDLRECI